MKFRYTSRSPKKKKKQVNSMKNYTFIELGAPKIGVYIKSFEAEYILYSPEVVA